MQSHSVPGLDKQAIETSLQAQDGRGSLGKVPFTREPYQTSGSCQWTRFINASAQVIRRFGVR